MKIQEFNFQPPRMQPNRTQDSPKHYFGTLTDLRHHTCTKHQFSTITTMFYNYLDTVYLRIFLGNDL